ncbi:glycosyl hydrolase [Microdochium trichocladiopsis]|uniref:Glycosyl hydrolase n=1 Tax=Microdochium trichocladiopsis TaxID=1682393 RepID=A0A9P8Y211_9PEZI|nr:glycosyl hydrolase [Microdochium trichocladiopsis]KAH7028994.1 glycosyl hydrolase [Microdochium trichocladiopsis]
MSTIVTLATPVPATSLHTTPQHKTRPQQHSRELVASSPPHPLPRYHLKPPRGWINDPCAPAFDAATGTYHLYYQWNPNSCDWGDITWGQFTSRDGVYWSQGAGSPSQPQSKPIAPIIDRDQPYDKDGIFTGCLHPTGPRGEQGQLTVFYTSVCHLPLHWTLEHTRNSEGLSMATSTDGGRTWTKYPGNPIIKGEPESLAVTGFRDPFLAEWPAMDKARGVESSKTKTLYGAISGGIRGKNPTAFLYAVPADNLTEWTYLGPLVADMPLRFSAAPADFERLLTTWSGNFGVNWECVNFMTLESPTHPNITKEFMITGAEGGLKPGAKETDDSPYGQWSLWMAGCLRANKGGALSTTPTASMKHDYSGYLDHGCFYAASSYKHPVTNQRVVWGWLKEEDLTLARRDAKGWTGYLSLPRELFLQTLDNVVGVVGASRLEDVTSIAATPITGMRSSRTVETLGIRPLPSLRAFRSSQSPNNKWPSSPTSTRAQPNTQLLTPSSTSWELEATIRVPRSSNQQPRRVGFHIRHCKDLAKRCTVYFSPAEGRIYVDRSLSNTHKDICKTDASGPFALFITSDPTSSTNASTSRAKPHDGQEAVEALRLRLFSDGDVLEVFANDRFALSTMVYSDKGCDGISTFVEPNSSTSSSSSEEHNNLFESVQVWDGLGEARGIHDTALEATSLPGGRSAL